MKDPIKPYLTENQQSGALIWGPLTKGLLIRRYKRFLADVELGDGQIITAHTPNTGRMTGCAEPGRPVWLSHHDRPGRKYAYSWEMIEMPSGLVGVNTTLPNKLTALAIRLGQVESVGVPLELAREVSFGQSRLDLLVTPPQGPQIMVEVKNCTLAENGVAYFPDAVTQRGARYLEELAASRQRGFRAVIFILVQRADADVFAPADHIDPHWGRALRAALAQGVEILAYRSELTTESVRLGPRLTVRI